MTRTISIPFFLHSEMIARISGGSLYVNLFNGLSRHLGNEERENTRFFYYNKELQVGLIYNFS